MNLTIEQMWIKDLEQIKKGYEGYGESKSTASKQMSNVEEKNKNGGGAIKNVCNIINEKIKEKKIVTNGNQVKKVA